jgi:hypothetical protein
MILSKRFFSLFLISTSLFSAPIFADQNLPSTLLSEIPVQEQADGARALGEQVVNMVLQDGMLVPNEMPVPAKASKVGQDSSPRVVAVYNGPQDGKLAPYGYDTPSNPYYGMAIMGGTAFYNYGMIMGGSMLDQKPQNDSPSNSDSAPYGYGAGGGSAFSAQ